jgi:hypothetical protein
MPVQVPQRTDQGLAHLVIAGRDCGDWTVHTGGQMSAESVKTRTGYGLPEIELGSPRTVEGVTLERPYIAAIDGLLLPFWYSQCDHGEAQITRLYLDAEGFVVDRGRTRSGKLLVVTEPDFDVTSTDPAMMHLEFGMHGSIT